MEWSKKWQEHHKEAPEEEKHYSIRGDRTKARSGSFSGEPGTGGSRTRSGSFGAGRGAGAAGRGAGASKKPSKPKAVVGEDGWVEAVGDGKAPKGAAQAGQEEEDENAGRAVGGAFAALNVDSDSD